MEINGPQPEALRRSPLAGSVPAVGRWRTPYGRAARNPGALLNDFGYLELDRVGEGEAARPRRLDVRQLRQGRLLHRRAVWPAQSLTVLAAAGGRGGTRRRSP